MRDKRVLGVDPGQGGGLAIIHGGRLVKGIRTPVIEIRGKKILDARAVVDWWGDCLTPFDAAVIEAVHAMPNQGVSSTFQFGRMLGAIESLIYATGAPVTYVTPSMWKQAMGLTSSKQQSIDSAKLKFGAAADALLKRKADDGIAEAALLAAYWVERGR
jgi:Holliday junction resolvasome RuvABC endonuclease subunit